MPGGDRTGPMGAGPMTGRAAGFCAGSSNQGHMSPAGRPGWGPGQGYGWGRSGGWGGCGMGRRRGRGQGRGGGVGLGWGGPNAGGYPGHFGGLAPSREDELDMLKQQASQMEAVLDDIRKRMDDLETNKPEKE